MFKRKPDVVIERDGMPYLRRWYIIPRNRFFNIYLHHFVGSDPDTVCHDHPWHSASLVLAGGYWEYLQNGSVYWRKPWRIYFRNAETAHRIQLAEFAKEKEAWTLFFTGSKIRDWGFLCPKGWVPWQVFCDPNDPGKLGRGCD